MNEYLQYLIDIWNKFENLAYNQSVLSKPPKLNTKLVSKLTVAAKNKSKYEIAKENMLKVQQLRNKNNIAIPYIPEKRVRLTNAGKLTGAEFSTNMLDSIAKYGAKANLPIKQALGLAALESTFGNAKTNGYKSQKDRGVIYGSSLISNWAHGRENPWRDLVVTSEKKAGVKKAGKLDADYRKMNKEILDKSIEGGWKYTEKLMKKFNTNINVLEHGFDLFKKGKYNPGDPNHTKDVINAGRLAWGSPEILKWWRESGKKYYKNGGRLIPKKLKAWGKLEKIDLKNLTPRLLMLLLRSQQATKNIEQARQSKPEDTNKAELIRKEVLLVQNALNSMARLDLNLGKKYKQVSDNQVLETIDKFYPYKNMINATLTAAELASAGYFLTKGLGKGVLLGIKKIGTRANRYGHPVFPSKWRERYDKVGKWLDTWDKGLVTMNSIGTAADTGLLVMGDNSWQNKAEIGLDIGGVIGGTNVIRNTPWFGNNRGIIDSALDLGGYSAAGYDIYNYLNNE